MTAPERLGRYRVGRRIGEGGTAEVFVGHTEGAEGFATKVAIKRLRPALATDPVLRTALIAEARVARRLQHGNIAQITDLGLDATEVPYLVVEYVEGVALAEIVSRLGDVPVADALYLTEQLLAALEYAHGLTDEGGAPAGVIHRDVKPGNILVSRDGVVKLGDFGLARPLHAVSTTLPGMVKGTLGYLSPEQARGETVDARTDQFSAGVVLHELLTGHNPLTRSANLIEYVRALEAGLPPIPASDDVDDELIAIVARATAVKRADRFPSVAELRHALEAWRVARGVTTSATGMREAVRALMGEAHTGRGRALDGALAAQLDARPEARTAAAVAVPSSRRYRSLVAVAATAAVLAVLAWWWLSRTPQQSVARASDANAGVIPPRGFDARPPDATAAPTDAGTVDARIATRSTAARGRLKVNTIPWALVTVDGRALGQTPVDEPVSAGRHRVILENPDLGRRVERWIEVPSGTTQLITGWDP